MTARLTYKFDFFTADFLSSTATMTGLEAATFSLMLVLAWTQDASLPGSPERIRQALRYDPRDWRRVWPALESKWPVTSDGTRRNPAQVVLWEEGLVRIAKATEKAKAMAAARYGKPDDIPPGTPDSTASSTPESTAPSTASSTASSNAGSTPQASSKQCPSPSPSPSSEEKKEKRGGASRPLALVSSPPTIEEVRKEVAAKGYGFTAERFVSVNTAKGWKDIRDWRAACAAWQTLERPTPEPTGTGNPKISSLAQLEPEAS